MSAISGVWRPGYGGDHKAECQKILAAQYVFGREASDHFAFDAITLGVNLSRSFDGVPPAPNPASGAENRYWLWADARIDNREALATLLDISSRHLSAMSDPALIMAAFLKWNVDAFDKFVGDFALAIWDNQEQVLLLVRDALGMRPLHFYRSRGLIAFASTPMGLHALPDIKKEPDLNFLEDILFDLRHTGDQSFFADIKKVKPAHYLLSPIAM